MDNRVYIQFGVLKLPVIGGLHTFTGARGHDFAEYNIASGTNIIKSVGKKLRTHSLSIGLNAFLGHDIITTINTIDRMMDSGEAYDLIFINGLYKGKYVILDIRDEIKKTRPNGEVMEYEMTLEIKEYVDRTVLSENVQKNSKFKAKKQATISQREKTIGMNAAMPPNTKLKR